MQEALGDPPNATGSPERLEAVEHLQRKLDLANAELRARAEYIERLEADLSGLEARLASEPSVRSGATSARSSARTCRADSSKQSAAARVDERSPQCPLPDHRSA